jgi:3-hydroxyisobutyrate dehydrogenase
MPVGFIGLGSLGKTIANRLISEGVPLVVWNRTPSKAEGIGAEVATSPKAVAEKCDLVFVCLFDSAGVRAVLDGPEGILATDCAQKIVVDLSTNHFEPVVGFHEEVRARGASYLESPVLGSVVPASKGALTVLASGEKATYEKALPLLQKIGTNIFFLGAPGLATKMKLINNLCLGAFMATIAEAAVFGEAAGIERAKVLEILAAGAGSSAVLNAKREKLTKEDFSVHFSTALIHKDLHFLQDLARSLNRPIHMASAAKEIFGVAMSRGLGPEDFSAVFKALKDA